VVLPLSIWFLPPLSQVSPFMKGVIAEGGMEAALDLTANLTAAYTPQYFYDELRGLTDAAGGGGGW
jgi:hypothetical protein